MDAFIRYIQQAGEDACSDGIERCRLCDPAYRQTGREYEALFKQICSKLGSEQELIFLFGRAARQKGGPRRVLGVLARL